MDPITLAALISAGTSIGSSIFNREQSKRDIDRQNAYNSPIQQVARLKEAGLPMAALTDGHAGSQSALPQTSGQGIKDALGSFITTQLQKKQIELMEAQIRKTNEEAQGQANKNQIDMLDPLAGTPVSSMARMARLDFEMKQIQKEMMSRSKDIQELDYKVQKELTDDGTITAITRFQLQGLINGVILGNQSINKGLVMDRVIQEMKKGKGSITLFEALLMAFGTNQLSGGHIQFPSINHTTRNYNHTVHHNTWGE